MLTATQVIERFGGYKAVADVVGRDRNSVQRWTYSKDKGGCEDTVPSRHWAKLIEHAASAGIPVTLADLMPDDLAAANAMRPRRRRRAA